MPDETITEDEQVKRLLNRWFSLRMKYALISGFIGIALTACVAFRIPSVKVILPPLAPLIGGLLGSLPIYLATWYAMRQFVRRLTDNEREILIQIPDEAIHAYGKPIKDMRKTVHKIHPQREYLRPSQQPIQDDALLRAAQYTETTPQDQLLRPSTDDETT